MLTLKQVNLLDAFKFIKLYKKHLNLKDSLNYYSSNDDLIISTIIKNNTYIISNRNIDHGLIIAKKKSKEILFFPLNNSISIFKLLHLLARNFKLKYYSLKIIYNRINFDELKKYFDIKLSENMMYMAINLEDYHNRTELDNSNSLLCRPLKLMHEENLRAELQNSIFDNVIGRSVLTPEEILNEYSSPKFLKKFCFILESFRTPVGYGQILKFNDKYMLVNFGVISSYRNRGFGYFFLNSIFRECKRSGIKKLFLTVDKNNYPAITLYKKSGFKEIYNQVTISID